MNDNGSPFLPTAMRRRTLLAGLAASALASQAVVAFAQQKGAIPERSIRIIPFGTGGGPIDVIARTYAEKLHQRWGQPVVVEAKPGASGIIAADAVAKATPDGTTVMFTLPLTHINNAILQSKLPYDPVKDFEPISQLATGGPALVVRADAPFANLKDLVAFAKTRPSLTYGTWGNGSQAHLMGELLSRQAGIALIHVAYKSESAAHLDLMGGVLDLAWANPATAKAQSDAGKLKVLGISGSRRVSALPNVATFTEQGFAGFDLDSWIGVYAPAHTPPAAIAQWAEAMREITQMPDVRERLISMGFEPLGNTPAQFKASYAADYPRVAELIKAAGVTGQ